MKFFSIIILFFIPLFSYTQIRDTTKLTGLETIIIKAYEQNRKLKDVPAAINYINRQTLERFSSASIVQAVNSTAGVRMEERSPGSYRFNIRGSSLRSPFGVRNVKVYYNNIPFTDPGGQTYLNGLGYYNFSSIEIIKGPGSSLYGAGTGGVLLIESIDANEKAGLSSEYTAASYGLRNAYISAIIGENESKNKICFQHLQSEGYRYHSALDRNILSWNGRYKIGEQDQLKTTFLYSHLFYETPGALTKAEYDLNPKLARPAGGVFPGAEQSKASIQQKTFLAGLSYLHQFSKSFTNTTTAYGMFTELRNPAIRNYGKNAEPHAGGRTVFSYNKNKSIDHLQLTFGGEFQQGFSTITVYKNKAGNPDTLQTEDDIPIRQTLAFIQAGYERKGWELMAGGSISFLRVDVRRTAPFPVPQQTRKFTNELSPRLSLSKKWKAITVYSSVAKGFSPPSSAELLPSGSSINLNLSAERGINYDLGFKGIFHDINFDVNAFIFSLQNTIVQRRDAGGGDFYTNAGKTSQHGIETSITLPVFKNISFIRQSQFWISHTWHQFRYKEFKQLNTDFSGNKIPGIAPHTISTGIDLSSVKGLIFNINYYFSNRIPLNDANSEYANAYHLLNTKIGAEKFFGKWKSKLTVGGDNLLNRKYSLGNDINAAGGRFYNAAPLRNYYVSLALGVNYKK